jgi:hypothetical protein
MSSFPQPLSHSGSITAQPNSSSPTLPVVEVITMLGDSVVGVTHLEPSQRAPSRTHGHVALALGALLLLVAGLAFARGLQAAAADQAALVEWRDVLGRQVHEFRPTRLHPLYDWMALFGLAGGLAALTWGTVRLRARALRDTFTIGTEPGVDAGVSGPAGQCPARLALVRWDASGALVSVAEGMRARTHRDGRAYDIDAMAALGVARNALAQPGVRELDVPQRGSVRVDMGPDRGPLAFVIRMVAASRTRGLFGHPLPERRVMAFALGSLAAHLVLLALLNAIPPAPGSMAMGLDGASTRLVRARWKPTEDDVAQPSPENPQGGAPGASMDLSGDVRPVAELSSGGGPRLRDLQPRPPGSRDDAKRLARTQGMLAFLGSNPGVFDPLAEIGNFDAEPGAVTDFGMPVGTGPGSNWGSFGAGPGGFAWQGTGTVASGRYDTIGLPGSPGPGHTGFPGVGLNPRKPGFTGPTVHISPGTAIGALDPSIIRSRIKSKHERIRHCYERTLLTAPELTGTVVTKFVISPEGKVIQASASGLGHDGVQSCIAEVIQGISFPRTSGGELTRVTYPFELRNTGR